MADYPTAEQLRDPEYVWPAEFAAPQDRGEPVPAANPAPGPGRETEPRTDLKEFTAPGDTAPAETAEAPAEPASPAPKATRRN